MIVEINWATGRVVRDYTFLLDPPGDETQAVEPAPAIVGQTAPGRAPRAGRVLQPRRTRIWARIGAPASAPADASGGYTVKRGDTLSKIAKEYKPENASLEQMLVAMFRSNEAAFDGKNMNRLRSGQILTIPHADQVAAMPRPTRKRWCAAGRRLARLSRPCAAGRGTGDRLHAGRQSAGGRIGTVVEDKAGARAPGGDQLQVSRAARPWRRWRHGRRCDRQGQGASRSQRSRCRTREDGARSAAGRRAAQPDDGRPAGACCRSGQGQGRRYHQDRAAESRRRRR